MTDLPSSLEQYIPTLQPLPAQFSHLYPEWVMIKMCLPDLHEENELRTNRHLWGKQYSITYPACKHVKTLDTHGIYTVDMLN